MTIPQSPIFSLYEEFLAGYLEDMGSHCKSSPFRGFRAIGPQRHIIYARSLWEANYARYLQYLQDKGRIRFWLHEPKTFYFDGIMRGCTNYTPDFFVCTGATDDEGYWVEVKGFMDAKSATKIKRFQKYYPEEKLVVVDKEWFKVNNGRFKELIPDWESKSKPPLLIDAPSSPRTPKAIEHPKVKAKKRLAENRDLIIE